MNITRTPRKNATRSYQISVSHHDLTRQIHALRVALLREMDELNRDTLVNLLSDLESAYYYGTGA